MSQQPFPRPTGLKADKGIELLTWGTPNGVKASILLEELKDAYGKEYTWQAVDISTNVQKEEWFTKLGPNGRIPVIVDHDKGGFAVMEGLGEFDFSFVFMLFRSKSFIGTFLWRNHFHWMLSASSIFFNFNVSSARKDHDDNVFYFGIFLADLWKIAILNYLTRHYDPEHKFSFEDPLDVSRAEQWMAWQHGGLGPMQGQANHFNVRLSFLPSPIPYS